MAFRQLNFYVYDENAQCIGVIDRYLSLVWSDRYIDCGEFELEVPYSKEYRDLLLQNRYCTVDYTDRFGVIEKVEISKEEEAAPKMVVSGRSLECILERRIIVKKTEFGSDEEKVSLQESVQKLINDSIINPEDGNRRIDKFVFTVSNEPEIIKLKISESFNCDNLYDAIKGICEDKHIGFKIVFDAAECFDFSLYKAKDRSVDVIFSPFFDNLNSSSYYSSVESYKNMIYISKEEDEQLTFTNLEEMPKGLARRETHEDVSALKENEKTELTDEQIKVKAVKKLNQEHKIATGFEGDIVPDVIYTYLKDYNVGDKVTFEDAYGNSEVVYISEVAITYDENGLSIIPTFKEIDWYEDEDENNKEE